MADGAASRVDGSWMQQWVAVLERASADDQPIALRLSAARSLQHSAVLTVLDPALSPVSVLRLALVALTLLQDDDDEVREVANALLVPAYDSTHLSNAVGMQESTVPPGFPATEVGYI
jgi:hypothetical protein